RRDARPSLVLLDFRRRGLEGVHERGNKRFVVVTQRRRRRDVRADGKDDRPRRWKLTKRLTFHAKEPFVEIAAGRGARAGALVQLGTIEQGPVQTPKRLLGRQAIEESVGRAGELLVVERHRRGNGVQGRANL